MRPHVDPTAMDVLVAVAFTAGWLDALVGMLGHVLWLLGAGMALANVANVAGGVVGARTALARGAGFVRAVLLVVVVALVATIVHDRWLAA